MDEEALKFGDWHDSHGSLFVDWDAAFSGWIRKAREIDDRRGIPKAEPDEPLFAKSAEDIAWEKGYREKIKAAQAFGKPPAPIPEVAPASSGEVIGLEESQRRFAEMARKRVEKIAAEKAAAEAARVARLTPDDLAVEAMLRAKMIAQRARCAVANEEVA